MKIQKLLLCTVVAVLMLATLVSCNKGNNENDGSVDAVTDTISTVTDICGNIYPVIKIGNQYWMAENMRCNKYDTESEREGYTIPTPKGYNVFAQNYIDASDKSLWDYSCGSGARLTRAQIAKLGYLYNWAAAVGLSIKSGAESPTSDFFGNRQGICPNGWHIPTDAEWNTLITYIEKTDCKGTADKAGTQLMTTSGWCIDGLDTYGFSALPSGEGFKPSYADTCEILYVGVNAWFWSATPNDPLGPIAQSHFSYLMCNNEGLKCGSTHIGRHYSVRCVKDVSTSGYVVKFLNDDGTELQCEELEYGALPEYKGDVPTKQSDARYIYTFVGWKQEIPEVTSDKIYTAQYSTKVNDKFRISDICGNTYKCVAIGDQVWMAENMRCTKYDTASERAGKTLSTSNYRVSFAPYYTDPSNKSLWSLRLQLTDVILTSAQLSKLGYLYNWAAAVGISEGDDVSKRRSVLSYKRQGICPNGWHVPKKKEWETLVSYINKTDGKDSNNAGAHLKTTSGWDGDNAFDTYGFSALPSGEAAGSEVNYVGGCAYFWAATPYYNTSASCIDLFYDRINIDTETVDKACSVRCIMDE